MSVRKVVKIGNSLGITIPAEIIDKTNINLGDPFSIDVNDDGKIILTPIRRVELPGNISPEVLDVAYRVMEKYGETLKGLQDR